MSKLRRIVLVRHGETTGESSIRFHGSTEVDLSDEGRDQIRAISQDLRTEVFDLVVASSARRAWQSAWILSGGAPVRLEADFREIDFGRWEGMTAAEIEARDPVLYKDWRARTPGFEFPEGEARAAFTERTLRGLDTLLASEAWSAMVVAHKGTIRTIAEKLTGEALADGEPPLAGIVAATKQPDGSWTLGRRGSNPPGVGEVAA